MKEKAAVLSRIVEIFSGILKPEHTQFLDILKYAAPLKFLNLPFHSIHRLHRNNPLLTGYDTHLYKLETP